ncbi:MAG TPA: hypothetical protein VHB77_13505, partial [Planctomycetaceae bacterium]|nr:hypothetical protein [Planctomycetaceae bacterium]
MRLIESTHIQSGTRPGSVHKLDRNGCNDRIGVATDGIFHDTRQTYVTPVWCQIATQGKQAAR